jgi:S1/P1 Nuclease
LNPFTECATFADEIKSDFKFQSGWHFIDQPYLD